MATRKEKIKAAFNKMEETRKALLSARLTKRDRCAEESNAREALDKSFSLYWDLDYYVWFRESLIMDLVASRWEAMANANAAKKALNNAEDACYEAFNEYSNAVQYAKDDAKRFTFSVDSSLAMEYTMGYDAMMLQIYRLLERAFQVTKENNFPNWPVEFKDVKTSTCNNPSMFIREHSWTAEVPLEFVLETPRTSREVMAYKDGHNPSCIWFKHRAYCNLDVNHSHKESTECYMTFPRGCVESPNYKWRW